MEVLLAAACGVAVISRKVSGDVAEELAELEALGLLELVAEVVSGHAMSLVDDDQIPARTCASCARRSHRETADPSARSAAGDARRAEAPRSGLAELRGEELEGEPELQIRSPSSTGRQAAGRDDQAALQVTAEHQLLDVEAGHDRLAGAGVVGEQEPQRGPLDQLTVDGLDLVRERLKIRRVTASIGSNRPAILIRSASAASLKVAASAVRS